MTFYPLSDKEYECLINETNEQNDKIVINLFEMVTIENNIFGYEIESILIIKINCKGVKLISTKTR